MGLGTIGLLFCLFAIICIVRRQFIKKLNFKIDIFFTLSLLLHLMWMIVVILLDGQYQYLVYDDESYYHVAMGTIYIVDGDNLYNYILKFIYDAFGQSSFNGRLVNMFVSLMTIYPLAYLEKELNHETRFGATIFFALSPFQIFISFFEIKDIILMFTYVSAYALTKMMKKDQEKSLGLLIQFMFFCAISEGIRSGMGIIPIAIFILDRLRIGVGISKIQRNISGFIFIILFSTIIYTYFQDYILSQSIRIDNYQKWIFTQFGSTSIYNKFIITDIKDIWKLPICFILYAVQPLNALDGSSRFFGEWGMFAKLIDVPILLMSIRWLHVFVKKEGVYSLMFIIPYTFVSAVNLSNARQGFFLYPIMYLINFYGFSKANSYTASNKILKVINSPCFNKMVIGGLYISWLFIVIIRS